MKYSKTTLALLPIASAKLNSPEQSSSPPNPAKNKLLATVRTVESARKLQVLDGLLGNNASLADGVAGLLNQTTGPDLVGWIDEAAPVAGGLTNGTGIVEGMMNGTGFFGMMNGTGPFAGMMNGTDPFAAMFNGTDPFAAMFNGTDPFAGTELEGLLGGENGTGILLGLMNGTMEGFQDMLAGMFGNFTGPMMGGNFTDIFGDAMGATACPETCSDEACAFFSAESVDAPPDAGVLADACEAGAIEECSGMASGVCESLCGGDGGDGAAAILGLDASMLEGVCSFCTFLDCCDGVNSFDTCKANLPAEMGGEDSAAESTIVEDSTGEDVTTDGTAVEETTDGDAGADEESDATTDVTTDGDTTAETEETTASNDVESEIDAVETEDGSPATALLISRCASVISLVLLFNAF